MSNKFTIAYKSKEGTELHNWLLEHGDSLRNKRIFYVVRANLEQKKDVYKIGISERGDNSAIGRLIDYVHFYGVSNDKNKCQGVKLHLLLANVFNPDVTASHAAVRRLETKVIADYADKRERGRERIHVSIEDLFKYLEKNNYIAEDIENVTRKTPRLAEKEQAANVAVKKIVEETTDRKGRKKYEVEFMEGFKYDRNENQVPFKRPNAVFTYEEIVEFPRGKQLLDEFIKQNNISTSTTQTGARVTRLRGAQPTTVTQPFQPVSSRTRGNARVTTI